MIRSRTVGGIAVAAVLALPLVMGSVASGDEKKEKGWEEGDKKSEEKKGIEYPGVDPEKKTGIAPLIEKAKKSKKTVVTWPGFQMVYGGSRVFVQLLKGTKVDSVNGPSRVSKPPFKVSQPSLVYVFPKKVVLIKNNLNPLITRSFNTPVNVVRMKRKKGSVYMILEMRTQEEPVREELMKTEDGYYFFFVEFASGEYLPKVEKTETEKSEE
jgi:hypothetical protein